MKRLLPAGALMLAVLAVPAAAALPTAEPGVRREVVLASFEQVPAHEQVSVAVKWCKACMDLECYAYLPYPCWNQTTDAEAERLVDASSVEASGTIEWKC